MEVFGSFQRFDAEDLALGDRREDPNAQKITTQFANSAVFKITTQNPKSMDSLDLPMSPTGNRTQGA